MLKNLHLVGENEDDGLYSEFQQVNDEVGRTTCSFICLYKAVCLYLYLKQCSIFFWDMPS